jgi:hypothetical protein
MAEDGRKLAVPTSSFLAKACLEIERPAGDEPVLGNRNELSSGRLPDRFVGQARRVRAHLFDDRFDFALAIVQGQPSPQAFREKAEAERDHVRLLRLSQHSHPDFYPALQLPPKLPNNHCNPA